MGWVWVDWVWVRRGEVTVVVVLLLMRRMAIVIVTFEAHLDRLLLLRHQVRLQIRIGLACRAAAAAGRPVAVLKAPRDLKRLDHTAALGVKVVAAHLLTHEHEVPVDDLNLALVLVRVGLGQVPGGGKDGGAA